MAIGQSGMFYDANRDMYVGSDYYREKEREYRRHQEEMLRQQHMMMQNPSLNPYVTGASEPKKANPTPAPDTKDPLAFLQNTDKKLLLTGEMQ